MVSDTQLAQWVRDARARSLLLLADLDDAQLEVPYLATINPLLWELGHLVYFQELWVLRRALGQLPRITDADALFDSITIGHEQRWRLPVPPRAEVEDYAAAVRDAVLDALAAGVDDRVRYLIRYAVFHEDMHAEALTYARQTLGLPPPRLEQAGEAPAATACGGDVEVAGGAFRLGAERGVEFCFDNEKWAHDVEVAPFRIARCAVTDGELAAFVADGGYHRQELWSSLGWAWRQAENAALPLYWRLPREAARSEGCFERRTFDRWAPIDPAATAVHVNQFEAEAFCRWAGRRLPGETEWERAAADAEDGKRLLPWRDGAPCDARRAHVDGVAAGPAAATAYPDGDSALGCRQMLGNVWEWTATTFAPYPGFTADMYEDYSQTSFHTRKVLRGGCFATRGRVLRTTWRNYYQPARRDVFAGFRTCAVR